MVDAKVPVPGPAKLKRNAGPDEWLEAAKDCKYLSEQHMKELCEIVKEYMMEGVLLPFMDSGKHSKLTRLLFLSRIQYPTRFNACDYLRRHSWPVLRSTRAIPSVWWNAERDWCRGAENGPFAHYIRGH